MLWATNEVIWYSQRDDWAHLYLYDLATGTLKNRITTGEGPVTQIMRRWTRRRARCGSSAMGREKGQDPYFRHLYRVGLDGKSYVSLTPDDGDHSAQLSPSGKFIVDTYSTPRRPAGRRRCATPTARLVMPLEKADISKLLAPGWKPPMPITVKARDGKTDLYGMMFVPTRLRPGRRSIRSSTTPTPARSRAASARARSRRRAATSRRSPSSGSSSSQIDGMGTPGRSKSFHDAYYGAMGRDNTLPDQVAGMKELAQKYP